MPERRTKEQKMKAQQRRELLQYSFTAPKTARIAHPASSSGGATLSSTTTRPPVAMTLPYSGATPQLSARSIFAYDTKLIFDDLKKTIVITIGILLLLFAAVLYLHGR